MHVDQLLESFPEVHLGIHMVLLPEGVDYWLNELVLDELGCTPAEALEAGRESEVQSVLDSYLDPSYQ